MPQETTPVSYHTTATYGLHFRADYETVIWSDGGQTPNPFAEAFAAIHRDRRRMPRHTVLSTRVIWCQNVFRLTNASNPHFTATLADLLAADIMTQWESLNRRIVACDNCPRLRDYCRRVATQKRRAYAHATYWGKPVANFGDAQARLLIVGLAPGAHGANRTGRMFTGDRSGDWLYRALHKAGFANQPQATHRGDSLRLFDCAITAVCHCAPPDNKPTTEEVASCRVWLTKTIDLLRVRVFLALGQLAWSATLQHLSQRGDWEGRRPKFSHGARIALRGGRWLLASYHPSQQNTFTGRLTEEMLDDVFRAARQLLTP